MNILFFKQFTQFATFTAVIAAAVRYVFSLQISKYWYSDALYPRIKNTYEIIIIISI